MTNRFLQIALASFFGLSSSTVFAKDKKSASAEVSEQKLKYLQDSFGPAGLKAQKSRNPFGAVTLNSKPAPETDCLHDESLAFEIERSLVNVWEKTWKEKNLEQFTALTAEGFAVIPWTAEKQKMPTLEFAEVKSLRSTGGTGNLETVKNYLGEFSRIEDLELDFINMTLPSHPASKTPQIEKFNEAVLMVRFDLRGMNGKTKRNDTGTFEVKVAKSAGQWKIKSLSLLGGRSIASSKVFFEDGSKTAKLDQLPTYIRNEAIRRGGYALAVADFNNDGVQDLFIGNDGASAILRGNKDGTFTEDKDSPLAKETAIKTAIFADMNNDGWQDLTLIKFVKGKNNSVVSYLNNNGKFNVAGQSAETKSPDYAMPAAVGDFNTDGYLDMYVGFPGIKDFTNMDLVPGGAKRRFEQTPHGLYLNDRKGALLEANSEFKGRNPDLFPKVTFGADNLKYPHSAIAVDYDNDGHQDIIVMDDRGGVSPVFRNLGGGQFEQVADKIGVANRGYGMGAAVADFNNDGLMDIAMTNVDFTASHRLVNSCLQNHDRDITPSVFTGGMRLFKNLGGGKFADVTQATDLAWIGQGAGGVEFVDFDNDGWQDIYVVNGLWSGTERREDLASFYNRAVLMGLAWDRPELDFGRSGFMSILADHKGGVFNYDAKSGTKLSMGGFQRNRLFRNNHDGSFVEMGYLAGVDSLADGYVVAKADLNKDGNTDLILRNADPGTHEHTFPSVQIFMNQGPTGQKAVTVRLLGKRSNRDGIGAKVTAWVGDRVITQELIGNNGAAQGEKLIHIGLGGESRVAKLEVLWPSGLKSEMKKVPAGEIVIEEPTSTKLGSL